MAAASARAEATVAVTAEDFGLEAPALVLDCDGECFAPGSDVVAEVAGTVNLPGIPSLIAEVAPLAIDLHARGASPVDGDG
ncbi:hypothetical protein [Demequina litorisediminis]|nr:hypothetical protein [Demequina litorisediminis]